MANLKTIVDQVYIDLEDPDQSIWPDRTEVEGYVKIGYDKVCRMTEAIWDITFAENIPYAGDHTGVFEESFMSGGPYQNLFNFTGGEWERDYIDNGIGPANHTSPWESDNNYTTDLQGNVIDYILATSKLTPLLLMIDRVTHDNYRVLPAYTARIRRFDGRYLYTTGPTRTWLFEEDGILTLRKVPVPAARANTFTYKGTYGLLRKADNNEFGIGPAINGVRGVLRAFPQFFPAGHRRGLPRRLYDDTKNVRVEVIRRGYNLSDAECEFPDRWVRLIQHFARHKCLEREGEGQDLRLSDHFKQRFEDGITRLIMRRRRELYARVGRMGSGGQTVSRPPLVKFPWPYPAVRW